MELSVCEFNLRDLIRELYGRGFSTEGTKQDLQDRLLSARHEKAETQAQGFLRPGRPPITKFGACVQPDDFAQIECMTDDEYAVYSEKVKWRLRRIHKTYSGNGLEYYHPGVLHRIDRSKTYALHINEFWVRQEPYIHKIFVVFVSRTNGEEQRLCYARSLAKMRTNDTNAKQLKTPLITNVEIGRILTNILLEIEHNGLENYVAVIVKKNKINMKTLMEVKMVTGQTLPQIVLDTCHLNKIFETIFCSKSARCLAQLEHEQYVESMYMDQLNGICQKYTKTVEGESLLNEYKTALPLVLQAMWKVEEHRDKTISLACLNNDRLNAYSTQVQNDLPPITFEECSAGGGLLQLILFDALWCLCDGHEMEEETPVPTMENAIPDEWLPLLN